MYALLLTLTLLGCDGGDDPAATCDDDIDSGSVDDTDTDSDTDATETSTGPLSAAQAEFYGVWKGSALSTGCAGSGEGELELTIGALGDDLVAQDEILGDYMACTLDETATPAWLCDTQTQSTSAGGMLMEVTYDWRGTMPSNGSLEATFAISFECFGANCAQAFPEYPCSDSITATLTKDAP